MKKTINQEQALEAAAKPVRAFMFKQTREKDLALFVNLAKIAKPKNAEGNSDHGPDPGLYDQ